MAGRLAVTRGGAVGLLLAGLGAVSAAAPLTDSSFFTHLATGRIIWDGGGIPRSDPYTFTGAGEPWVVQSWFASVLYAGVESVANLGALRVLLGMVGAAIVAVVWALTRPAGSLSARLLVAVPVTVVLVEGWSERPLLIGLACLCGFLLVAEGGLDARWLLPIAWLWVNTHGSWPLGYVLLGLLLVGRWLDREPVAVEVRAVRWALAGLVVSLANPYGPKLLAFPATLVLGRRESLAGLREWQAPTYDRLAEQLFLVVVLVALVAFARRRSWRAALPGLVFVVAAATGARNVLPAVIVLVPGSAGGLAGWGSVAGEVRDRFARHLGAIGVALLVAAVAVGLSGEPIRETAYPVAADAWLRDNGLGPDEHRVIAREVVGNWWELRDGPTQQIFIDDRVEVVPLEVVEDHGALLRGEDGWQAILDRYDAEAVLWEAELPLAALLDEDPGWRVAYRDDRFVVAVPA